jgi:hypothetical protein
MAEALTCINLSTKPYGCGGKMIKHIVMVKFKPEVSQQQQAEAAKKSGEALAQLPGVKNLIIGPALPIEGTPRYDAVLLIDFDDEAQLKAYLEHPTHKAVDAQVLAMCSDGLIIDCPY